MTLCGRCGAEVRWGTRDLGRGPQTGFWHREETDHAAVVGTTMSYAESELFMRETAARRASIHAEKKGRKSEEEPEDTLDTDDLAVEIWSTPVEPKDKRVPGGVRTITNLVNKTPGWEVKRLTYARGPWGSGHHRKIVDTIVLGAQRVDEPGIAVVTCHRDGKFEFGYAFAKHQGSKVNATELKTYIRENPA